MHPKKLKIDFDYKNKSVNVFVKQNLLSKILEGKWVSNYRGEGMEFSDFRNYFYGDDASSIDWKASLKSGTTLVREYEQDRLTNVFFLFDVGDSMLFSSKKDGKMKAEFAAELIYNVSNAILKSGDASGLIMFNNSVVKQIEPNIGLSVQNFFKTELSNPKNYGGKFDFIQAMKIFLGMSDRKILIIIVSDFIGLPKNWHRYIGMLNQKYEVMGWMIKDHRDRFLPKTNSQLVLEDPSTNETIYVDSKLYAEKYHKQVLEEEEEIKKKFKAAKSDVILIETIEDGMVKIVNFFSKRANIKRN